jgi:hypothetical protein
VYREKQMEERERKNGEKRKYVGPVTVINWDPHKFFFFGGGLEIDIS